MTKRSLHRHLAVLMFLFAAVVAHGQSRIENSSHISPPQAAQTKQAGRQTYVIRRGENEFGFWAGGSSKPITAFGGVSKDEARDRKFLIVAAHYGRVLAADRSMALEYTIDAIPLAIATDDIVGSASAPISTSSRGTAYGFGVVPLGLMLSLRNSSGVKPFVNIGAGGMLFNKPVPLPDAGRFAFVLEGGGGVRIFASSGRAVWLGAKLHHLSNGNRSGSNRGLNQLVFYGGLSVFK